MERLTTKQASEILGISRRRVIALIEQGKLKADKFAGVYTIAQKDLETVRNRKNGRPPKTENGNQASGNQKPFKTIFDVAPELVGCLDSGLGDLSTNKKYMEGFGTKEGEKRDCYIVKRIIADAATIVALIDKRDNFHQWASTQAESLPIPFLTCEAVISESCYLLHNIFHGEKTVLTYLKKGILQIDFSLSNEIEAVQILMKKYDSVPMSLADACLVRMSEQHENSVVFTVDGDFVIYRKNGRQEIPLLIPDESRKTRNKRKS